MKIAYLGIKGLPAQGGAERVVESLLRYLQPRHDIKVYGGKNYLSSRNNIQNIELIGIPALRGKHLRTTSLVLFSALHALVKGKYDLIHLHNVEASFVLPLLRLRYKVISTSHGPAYARAKWGTLAKLFMRLMEFPYSSFSNIMTSVSEPLARYYEQKFKKRVYYIPNGVEKSPHSDIEAASNFFKLHNIQPKQFILFAAGRIEPTKGCHTLLEAFKKLDADIPLLIVGDLNQIPSYGEKLRAQADSRIKFIPLIQSQEKLYGILQQARFFVFPSTVEAMSMILLEAAAFGVPTIASCIPENENVLGKHALYFQPENKDELADRLQWALDHPDEMKRLGLRAQAWAGSSLSWETIAKQYEELYQKLLSS